MFLFFVFLTLCGHFASFKWNSITFKQLIITLALARGLLGLLGPCVVPRGPIQ